MGSSTNSPGAMWWRSFKQILIFHTWVGFPFHERMIRVVTSSVKFLKSHLYLQQPRSSSFCPGFGWDRVNFHKKPGRDTAGPADPNWPNKGVFATMCPHGVAQHWGGSWLGGGELWLSSALRIGWCERVVLRIPLFLYILLISIVVVTVHFLCCSVKLPVSRPTSFAFFFLFSLPSQWGQGW